MASTQPQDIRCGDEEVPSSSTSKEYQLKKYLLLLASLVVAVTYAAGLNLPGGVRQEDGDTKDGHHLAGELILLYTHHGRYLTFYYCNATAFAASVVVCLLLLILKEGNNAVCETVLRVVMVLDLLGLMGAYAAGSCRDAFTSIYSTLVMSVVLAYAVLAFSLYIISKIERCKGGKQQQKEDHESQSQSQSRHEEVESIEVLMLLATFVVTITYGAGLSPPGGFWSDGDHVSFPILQNHNSARYQAFFVCNTTAFVASLLIIMLLLDKRLKKKFSDKITVRFVALYGLIVVALFGLIGAYAAGSCREIDNTIYVVSLIGAVLACIFIIQVAITKRINKAGHQEKQKEVQCPDKSTHSDREQDDGGNPPKKDEVGLEKVHELVILLATLVASITYQAGLDPPGGLWSDNDRDGHYKVGDPILLTTHPQRYKVFFYSNSAAFVASLVVILMVKCEFLVMRRSLEAAMIVDLFGLIVAYAAGCCRDVSTSIYVVALAGAILVYVVIHIIFLTLDQDSNKNNPAGDADELASKREVLLLLAILAATVTYQAGLTPPGGFWSADEFGHLAGYPVLLDKHPSHYNAFFYCNATSFMASVALIVLLVNPNLYKPGIRCYAFFVCMVVGLFGLMGAYAAGSSRQLRTSIYVLVLFALVFTCISSWVVILLIRRLMEHRHNKGNGPSVGDVGVGRTVNTNAPPEQDDEKEEDKKKKLREYLMLLGVLAASVAYQSGLKPPGGLWEDNKDGLDGHSASNSILHDIDKSRYLAFLYSNSTSFMASIVVIVLLLLFPFGHDELLLEPLHMAILLDLVGLLIAYAAGSTRDWEMSRNVIALVIPLLVYIALYAWYRRGNCSDGEATKVENTEAIPHDAGNSP